MVKLDGVARTISRAEGALKPEPEVLGRLTIEAAEPKPPVEDKPKLPIGTLVRITDAKEIKGHGEIAEVVDDPHDPPLGIKNVTWLKSSAGTSYYNKEAFTILSDELQKWQVGKRVKVTKGLYAGHYGTISGMEPRVILGVSWIAVNLTFGAKLCYKSTDLELVIDHLIADSRDSFGNWTVRCTCGDSFTAEDKYYAMEAFWGHIASDGHVYSARIMPHNQYYEPLCACGWVGPCTYLKKVDAKDAWQRLHIGTLGRK